MDKAETGSFSSPDDTRTFPNGKIDVVKIGNNEVGLFTLQPSWKWSNDVKPIAGTELCQAPHFDYQIQGTMRVRMEDGTEFETKAGDVVVLPEGHDAWVVGDEPVIAVDWAGASNYAK